MTDPHEELLSVLKSCQQRDRLSGRAFARKIGVSQQLWSAVVNGTKRIGRKLLAGAVQAYPEVQADVLRYLMRTGKQERSAA